ncbi:MAG: cytochrome P450, partial [Proteobacteria bacterium]|nr:cytochrome P450 [Pseudomonadota bacterium]
MLEDLSSLKAARERVADQAMADINVTDPALWSTDTVWAAFERLRREDPVHLHPPHQHRAGAFWSVTRYDDIVAVDTNHQDFSSEPSIFLGDQMEDFELPAFIQMDSPRHDVQRKTVSPIVSPHSLARMEPLIRSRIQETLDGLPIGEPFDWVDRVSVELTGQMLATLFDFPFEDRRKLTYWSDVAMTEREATDLDQADFDAHFKAVMLECAEYFTRLRHERAAAPPKDDLISMLAHGAATREMSPMEYLGNLILLIVGGNDTTRNTMSGSVLAMHLNP